MVPLELLESSHHQGFDYTGLLAKALKNDENAFKELIAFEVQNDTTVANQHAAILLTVLERLGDETNPDPRKPKAFPGGPWRRMSRLARAASRARDWCADSSWPLVIIWKTSL